MSKCFTDQTGRSKWLVDLREKQRDRAFKNRAKQSQRSSTVVRVPAFSIASYAHPVVDTGRPHCPEGPFTERRPKRSVSAATFRLYYDRGDLPVNIEHTTLGNRLRWRVDFERLDYSYILPIFFDGLKEVRHPWDFIANQGIHDLLVNGGHKVLPVVPSLIMPIKDALEMRNKKVLVKTLKVMQHLIVCGECVGETLVRYCARLLPVLNIFKGSERQASDGIEYGQQKHRNIGTLIGETLELLEMHGGQWAGRAIKDVVPTYESVVRVLPPSSRPGQYRPGHTASLQGVTAAPSPDHRPPPPP